MGSLIFMASSAPSVRNPFFFTFSTRGTNKANMVMFSLSPKFSLRSVPSTLLQLEPLLVSSRPLVLVWFLPTGELAPTPLINGTVCECRSQAAFEKSRSANNENGIWKKWWNIIIPLAEIYVPDGLATSCVVAVCLYQQQFYQDSSKLIYTPYMRSSSDRY